MPSAVNRWVIRFFSSHPFNAFSFIDSISNVFNCLPPMFQKLQLNHPSFRLEDRKSIAWDQNVSSCQITSGQKQRNFKGHQCEFRTFAFKYLPSITSKYLSRLHAKNIFYVHTFNNIQHFCTTLPKRVYNLFSCLPPTDITLTPGYSSHILFHIPKYNAPYSYSPSTRQL